jgi:hypothetical protein
LTNQEIQEIEERAEKATPGPWSAFQWGDGSQKDTDAWNVGATATEIVLVYDAFIRDAEFIAHSRQDIPKLIAALREARAVLQHVRNRIRDPLMRKYILEVLERDNAP